MFYACHKTHEDKKEVWYLDSGYSNHMTADKDIFLDMDSSFNSKVKLRNGDHVEIKGKGSIAVETKEENKAIHDVYVPDLD